MKESDAEPADPVRLPLPFDQLNMERVAGLVYDMGLLTLQVTKGSRQHWLGITLQTAEQSTPTLQCRIDVELPDSRTLTRTPRTDGSYLSTNDPRVLFGMGNASDNVALRIYWRDGSVELFNEIQVDQYVTLVKGEGTAE